MQIWCEKGSRGRYYFLIFVPSAIIFLRQRSSGVEQRFRNLEPEVPFHRVSYCLVQSPDLRNHDLVWWVVTYCAPPSTTTGTSSQLRLTCEPVTAKGIIGCRKKASGQCSLAGLWKMKKALRGSLCAYCGERPATTEDHVIGRKFFPVHLRSNLPKVLACSDCNGRKSNFDTVYQHQLISVRVLFQKIELKTLLNR